MSKPSAWKSSEKSSLAEKDTDAFRKSRTFWFEMPHQRLSQNHGNRRKWLLIFVVLTCFILSIPALILLSRPIKNVFDNDHADPAEPLFLTPLIERGDISSAMEKARVVGFPPYESYSGFITVNSTFNSNLFFWYFPAEGKDINDKSVPVILWSDGGPGDSSFYSVFGGNGHGPFIINADGDKYDVNPHSWHKRYHIIYMDNPVRVGYSFTESEDGFIESAPDAAQYIYEFLQQFFTLFPNLQQNPFYAAGVSYGSTYALHVANQIHTKNSLQSNIFINLKGLILDSPWIDAKYQIPEYANFLYNAGLISTKTRDYFNDEINKTLGYLGDEDFEEASATWHPILNPSTINVTGYLAFNNIYTDEPPDPVDMSEFGNKNSTRKALHVGAEEFRWFSTEQQNRMIVNVVKSSTREMETLLQAGYKFLVYVGNVDGLTGHLGVRKVIQSLNWSGSDDMEAEDWNIWRDNDRVAGYNMTVDNLTFLMVRNAGHGVLLYEPERVLSAVVKFINGGN